MERALSDEAVARRLVATHEYCAEQNVEKAVAAAKLAHQLVDEILAALKPGMRESEVAALATSAYAAHGIERIWHPAYARFGAHTLLTFRDADDGTDRILGETDIAFLDLGIVRDGIEGDAGRTIVVGADREMQHVADASRRIFDDALRFWQRSNPSGIALYEHIYALAAQYNVRWNLDPAGHLIGAFPHRGWKRGINHFPQEVASGKWILEIQVRHPTLPFGAFHEDLLYA